MPTSNRTNGCLLRNETICRLHQQEDNPNVHHPKAPDQLIMRDSKEAAPPHHRNKRRFRRLAFIVLGIFFFCSISAWWVGGKLLEPANRSSVVAPHDLQVEDVTFASKSGSQIAGWLSRVNDSKGVVVLAHPIRASRLSMVGRAKMFRDAGYSTLLIDMQAHGESFGQRITLGHLERHDVRAAVSYAKANLPGQPVVVLGWSLGGAAALLGSPLEIDALILESVYPDVDRAIHNRLSMRIGAMRHVAAPLLLMQLRPRLGVSANDLRPIDSIGKVECPVLVLAGTEDRHTTMAESRALFGAAAAPKELCEFNGASHENLYRFDQKLYRDTVLQFVESSVSSKQRATSVE